MVAWIHLTERTDFRRSRWFSLAVLLFWIRGFRRDLSLSEHFYRLGSGWAVAESHDRNNQQNPLLSICMRSTFRTCEYSVNLMISHPHSTNCVALEESTAIVDLSGFCAETIVSCNESSTSSKWHTEAVSGMSDTGSMVTCVWLPVIY